MIPGLLAGILMAVDSIILSAAMGDPVYGLGDAASKAPYISTLLQCSMAAVLILVYMLRSKSGKMCIGELKTKGGKIILLSTIFGGAFGTCTYFASIYYLGAAIAAAVTSIYPAIGAILAYFFLRERLSKVQISGVVLTIAGAVMLSLNTGAKGTVNSVRGLLFALFCCSCWAIESVLYSYGSSMVNIPSMTTTFFRQAIAAIFNGFIIIPIVRAGSALVQVAASKVLSIYIGGALVVVTSYLFYYSAIERIGPTKTTALNITYTAWTLLISITILGKKEPLINIIYCAVILIGSLMTAVNQKKEASAE